MTSDPQAPGQGGTGESSRLGIRSIKEVSSQRDEELAVIFREMRRASGITQEQVAGRLATGVATIDALESGALADLPEWAELRRIITTYAAQLGLDARPILRRLQAQLGVADEDTAANKSEQPQHSRPPVAPPQRSPEPAPPKSRATPTGLPMPPSVGKAPPVSPPGAGNPPGHAAGVKQGKPAAAPTQKNARPAAAPGAPQREATAQAGQAPAPETTQPATPKEGKRRRIAKAVANWLLLILLVAALGSGVWYASQNPRKVWSALDSLPDPIPGAMRAAWQMVRPLDKSTPGPRITDPGKRRSDKLP